MNGKKIIDSRWRFAYTIDNYKLKGMDLKLKKIFKGIRFINL